MVGVLWKARARGKVIGQGSEAEWINFRALLEEENVRTPERWQRVKWEERQAVGIAVAVD